MSYKYKVGKDTGYEPLPEGDYEVTVTNGDVRENKAKTGMNLLLTFQVISGEYANRTVRGWFCIEHPNKDVVKRHLEQVNKICKIAGKKPDEDIYFSNLIGTRLKVRLGVEGKWQTFKSFSPIMEPVLDEVSVAVEEAQEDIPF